MRRLIFIIFVSIIAFIFYILYTYIFIGSIALNLIFTIIGAFVTLGIFTIAYFQFLLTNTPWLDAKMVKDANGKYFDLHLFNAGPGLARDVTWLLKEEDYPTNYLSCSIILGIKCRKIDDFSTFQGTQKALSQNTGTLNVKGFIPSGCKGEDNYFTVLLKYSKLIWIINQYKYCKIVFSSEGKRLDLKYEINASEFNAEVESTKNFSQKLTQICKNP